MNTELKILDILNMSVFRYFLLITSLCIITCTATNIKKRIIYIAIVHKVSLQHIRCTILMQTEISENLRRYIVHSDLLLFPLVRSISKNRKIV